MKLLLGIFFACVIALPAIAEILVPVRTIRANTLLSASDFKTQPGKGDGLVTQLEEVAGMEARVALYANRPVPLSDVGPPALVDRNDLVRIHFVSGGLEIVADGRSLGRGAVGETIRVMNLGSRNTLLGEVQPDGSVKVGN